MREYDFNETYTRWILVEEMLPKMNGRYLLTVENFKNSTMVKLGHFRNGEFDVKNVIAWRQIPLPYPYKR